MPSDRPPLTQERLKELLRYDPETGVFTRLVKRTNHPGPGFVAGGQYGPGYAYIKVLGRRYPAHRLAFLYMTGEFPADVVDHINRDPSDNRWSNLRPATSSQNGINRGLLSSNSSGHRGVTWNKQSGKWKAYGIRDRRLYSLGLFASLEEAAAVAQKWREEKFKEFACPPNPEPRP